MKQPTERDELLRDVLAGPALDEFRNASLDDGLRLVRRTRQHRQAMRVAAYVALPLLIVVSALVVQNRQLPPRLAVHQPPAAPAEPAQTIPGTAIAIISDEQLLDLFQGRPVALVGQPGDQRLVLLDEVSE